MFHSHFLEVQCNIMYLIEQSTAATVCQGTFIWNLPFVLLMMELLISILYIILGILQGCLLCPTLKINIRVLCRSFAHMRI